MNGLTPKEYNTFIEALTDPETFKDKPISMTQELDKEFPQEEELKQPWGKTVGYALIRKKSIKAWLPGAEARSKIEMLEYLIMECSEEYENNGEAVDVRKIQALIDKLKAEAKP